jgi:hypothetical protein
MQAGRLHVELTAGPARAADIAKVALITACRPADIRGTVSGGMAVNGRMQRVLPLGERCPMSAFGVVSAGLFGSSSRLGHPAHL